MTADASELPKDGDQVYLDTLSVILDVAAALARAREAEARYRADRDSAAAFWAGRGDTARAGRIRRGADQYLRENQRRNGRLVAATLDCVVATAALSRIPVRHVRVTVTGDPSLASMSGTRKVVRSPLAGREY